MIKWQYRRVSTYESDETGIRGRDEPLNLKTLNDLGRDGWELVAICPALSHSGSAEYVFKRPLTALTEDKDDE